MKKVSLYKFRDIDNIPFNIKEYSRLKYGDVEIANKYGIELADFLFKKYKSVLLTKKVIISESAYNSIKNAASLITDALFNRLNVLLSEYKSSPVKRMKINREIPYTADYGTLNSEERQELLSQDKFTLDYEFCKNSFLIFIDDVYISGVHHRKIEETLNHYNINQNKCIGLYYGEYVGDIGFEIEAKLNYAEIDSSLKIIDLLYNTNQIIVRVVKAVLSFSNKELNLFFTKIKVRTIQEIYLNALAEGYLDNPKYVKNMNLIKKKLSKNIKN